MVVRLRLRRMGRHRRPFYRIVAVDKHVKRDGGYLESVGHYDPMVADEEKKYQLDKERAQHWLDQGAQPSEAVKRILKKHGFKAPRKGASPAPAGPVTSP